MGASIRRVGCATLLAVAACASPVHGQEEGIASRTTPDVWVDAGAVPGGDGSAQAPFDNIADALQYVRDAGGGLVVAIEPGTYPVDETLEADVPVELRGSNEQTIDDDGWPIGDVTEESETRIVATRMLGGNPLIRAANVDGVTVRDLSLVGGSAVLDISFAQDFAVQGNVIRSPWSTFGVLTVASSGTISDNYLSVGCCASCIGGGNEASPSVVSFVDNRSVHNGCGGVLLNGSGTGVLDQLEDHLEAEIRHNDLSHNSATSFFSFGIRVFSLRNDPPSDFASGHVDATIADNRIAHNAIGVWIDAGFPWRHTGPTCDTRVYESSMDLHLSGNQVTKSKTLDAGISFTRNTASFFPFTLGNWKYLHDSTITIDDPDGTLADAAVDNPETDPWVEPGPDYFCDDDKTAEPLGNTLVYNGAEVPHVKTGWP